MKIMMTLMLALSLDAFAHDEGHGPKLTDAPKQGGIVTSVVLASDAPKGTKAEMVYKAELVRASTGKVSVYYYAKDMSPLRPESFAKKAKAQLITEKKGKVSVQNFELQFVDDHFEGQAPKPARRPYSIDVKVMDGPRELLAAFDNLD